MYSGNSSSASSQAPGPGQQEQREDLPLFSPSTYELLALLIATIGILGLCNNLLVLVLYYRFQRLRTPTNLFLLNISLSDLLVSLCGGTLTFVSCLRSRWVWDAPGCVWDGFSNSLFGKGEGRRPHAPNFPIVNLNGLQLKGPHSRVETILDIRVIFFTYFFTHHFCTSQLSTIG
uniref:G-protein coupled receptors family 1 profile domain-containing protein n=1 Tax=Chrysemys picta bellii TaxID=8478 RepID=A0A8C3P841_CHRPI